MSIRSKRLRIVATMVLGILMLGAWLYFIDIGQTLHTLQHIQIGFALAGFAALALNYFIGSQRWRLLFSSVGEMKMFEAFKYYMAGVAINFILPIRAGEVAKSLFLRQIKGTPVAKSMATIVVDRSLDLAPVFVVLLAIPFLPFTFGPVVMGILLSVVLILVVLAGGVAAAILLRRRDAKGLTRSWANKLWMHSPEFIRNGVGGFANTFIDSLSASAIRPKIMAGAIGLTLLSALEQSLCSFFVYRSIGYPLPYLTALIGLTIFQLTFLFPTPPGQMGSLEVMMSLVFSTTLGVPLNTVSAAAIVGHSVTTLVVLGVGGFCLNALGVGLSGAVSVGFSQAKPGANVPQLEATEGRE